MLVNQNETALNLLTALLHSSISILLVLNLSSGFQNWKVVVQRGNPVEILGPRLAEQGVSDERSVAQQNRSDDTERRAHNEEPAEGLVLRVGEHATLPQHEGVEAIREEKAHVEV